MTKCISTVGIKEAHFEEISEKACLHVNGPIARRRGRFQYGSSRLPTDLRWQDMEV
jgi:hypothetical protein